MRIPWRIRRINSREMDNAGTEMEQKWYKEVFLCQKSLVNVNLGRLVSPSFLHRTYIKRQLFIWGNCSFSMFCCNNLMGRHEICSIIIAT